MTPTGCTRARPTAPRAGRGPSATTAVRSVSRLLPLGWSSRTVPTLVLGCPLMPTACTTVAATSTFYRRTVCWPVRCTFGRRTMLHCRRHCHSRRLIRRSNSASLLLNDCVCVVERRRPIVTVTVLYSFLLLFRFPAEICTRFSRVETSTIAIEPLTHRVWNGLSRRCRSAACRAAVC